MAPKNLEDKFEKLYKRIVGYSKMHAHLSTNRTDFAAYKELVALGAKALPLLRRKIGEEDARWYVILASNEILKKDSGFEFPEAIKGYLPQMEEYLADYLDRKGYSK